MSDISTTTIESDLHKIIDAEIEPKQVSAGKRFTIGSIRLPAKSACFISACVKVRATDSSGIVSLELGLSEDRDGEELLAVCNVPDSISESAASLSCVCQGTRTLYLVGTTGSNIEVETLKFNALCVVDS